MKSALGLNIFLAAANAFLEPAVLWVVVICNLLEDGRTVY
jgi:hypothetical protein